MSNHTHVRAQLLLATLQRAGRPMGTSDLRDEAAGLALAEGWCVTQLATYLSRRNIAALMRNMVRDTPHVQDGPAAYDAEARKPTPTYVATRPNPQAVIPPPPDDLATTDEPSPLQQMDREQMLAVLDVSDQICGAVSRFLRDMQDIQSRARRDLQAKGLEVPR